MKKIQKCESAQVALTLPRKHSQVGHVFEQNFDTHKTVMPAEWLKKANEEVLPEHLVIDYCRSIYLQNDDRIGLFVCSEAGLHSDDVAGNFTVGFVFHGNHQLRSSRSDLGALRPGSIFLLNNTKRHGAFKSRPDSPRLVFAAHDFDAWSMSDAILHARSVVSEFLNPLFNSHS